MAIKHCVIHRLLKETPEKQAALTINENELIPEDAVASLFTQLKQNLQKSATRQYGCFDVAQTDNPLPALIQKKNKGELGFITMTHKISEHLKLACDDSEEVFSSHLLFVVEELMEQEFLYLFWVFHSDANYINSELEVGDLSYIDTGRQSFVLKLDISQWQVENWQQYLTLQMSRGNKNLSHAFTHASGFVSSVNLQNQTNEFLEIVDQYADTLEKIESNNTKHAIVNYCVDQDMQGNAVNFESLSGVLNEKEPNKFSDFVKENQEEPQEEIYAHRNSLKKYVRFYGREKDLSISFSSDQMGENITFDPQSGSLTFKQVPKSLQAQLAKFLKKQSE